MNGKEEKKMTDLRKAKYGNINRLFKHVNLKLFYLESYQGDITEEDVETLIVLAKDFAEIQKEFTRFGTIINELETTENVLYLASNLGYFNRTMDDIIDRNEALCYIRLMLDLEYLLNDAKNDLKQFMDNQGYLEHFNLISEPAELGCSCFLNIDCKDIPGRIEEVLKTFFNHYSEYWFMREMVEADEAALDILEYLEQVKELTTGEYKNKLKLLK